MAIMAIGEATENLHFIAPEQPGQRLTTNKNVSERVIMFAAMFSCLSYLP